MANFIQLVEPDERFDKKIGDSTFNCRRFTSSILKGFEKDRTKYKRNKRTGQMEPHIDQDKVQEDLINYCIVGWKDVKSPTTDTDPECSLENKLKLPGVALVDILESCDAENIIEKKTDSES